jgi:hypothetical protein
MAAVPRARRSCAERPSQLVAALQPIDDEFRLNPLLTGKFVLNLRAELPGGYDVDMT